MKKVLNRKQKGFTIIEVMIVLAIAGIIMLVVFLAIPSLQRSSRNTQRRNDIQHMAGLINEYKANHNGQAPATINAAAAGTNLDLASENFSIMTKPVAGTGTGTAVGALPAGGAPANPALDAFYVYRGATCDSGANVVTAGGGSRSMVIWFSVEPGTTSQCIGV